MLVAKSPDAIPLTRSPPYIEETLELATCGRHDATPLTTALNLKLNHA
jgi:hypothetical protein